MPANQADMTGGWAEHPNGKPCTGDGPDNLWSCGRRFCGPCAGIEQSKIDPVRLIINVLKRIKEKI